MKQHHQKNGKNDFNNIFLGHLSQVTLNSERTDYNLVSTKSHVYFWSDNDKNKRDLFSVLNDQDNKFDNYELANL